MPIINAPIEFEEPGGSRRRVTLDDLRGTPGKDGDPGEDGDQGLSAYQVWLDAGNVGDEAAFLASLKGERGDDGDDGASAYQVWIAAGNTGTAADFLASLKGATGEPGPVSLQVKGFVTHGSNASVARPSGFGSVEWVGSVEPVNATDDDTWIKVA